MHRMQLEKFTRMVFVSILYASIIHAADRIEQRQKDRALMAAVKIADVVQVAHLLRDDANPNYRRALSGETVLMAGVRASVPLASTFDIVIVARMLIERGADVTAIKTKHDGITALHCVVQRPDISNAAALPLIKLLLDAGARRDIRARSSYAQLYPRWYTPAEQAMYKKLFWRGRYPKLSMQFAWRESLLRNYVIGGHVPRFNDRWVADPATVTRIEKSAYTLSVDDAMRSMLGKKAVHTKQQLKQQRSLVTERPDLFKEGW